MPNVDAHPHLIIVMGLAGSGKSTLATLLAKQLRMTLIEADDYHSDESVSRMRLGIPLSDNLRKDWIDRLCEVANQNIALGNSMVMAYSGLKSQQRQQFNELKCQTTFLFLNLGFTALQTRLANRESHFFPASLLQSQFDDFEPLQQKDNEFSIEADKPVEDIMANCLEHIKYIRGKYAQSL